MKKITKKAFEDDDFPLDELEDEEIEQIMKDLSKDGKLVAICYKCLLPISHQELIKEKCSTCGKIQFSMLEFREFGEGNDVN